MRTKLSPFSNPIPSCLATAVLASQVVKYK